MHHVCTIHVLHDASQHVQCAVHSMCSAQTQCVHVRVLGFQGVGLVDTAVTGVCVPQVVRGLVCMQQSVIVCVIVAVRFC